MTTDPRRDETPPSPNTAPEKKDQPGWIENFAQRSAGLPGASPPPSDKAPEKSPWSYAGIGIQFAFTTALFTMMGLYVDHHWNTTPWGTLGLTMLGLVGGMYLLIKEALRQNADAPKKNSPPPPSPPSSHPPEDRRS